MMRDDGEMLQLFGVHLVRPGEITHVDDIGFHQLIERRVAIVCHQRCDHSLLDRRKGVRHQAQPAQFQIDIAKHRLALVERDERNLGLNHDRFGQARRAVAKNR
jgi:hypothetical protein